jgi:2,4-dienoyl-CoA reductase-like NADH-dependent reductase (Old Yellow Enzyme family)
MPTPLAEPLALPSGLRLPNRLAKAATSERLAGRGGAPTPGLIRLYERWGGGGAGLLLTGNVIVAPGGEEARGNVVLGDDAALERQLPLLTAWAARAQAAGARMVMQISHGGRQSPRRVNRDPVAPSAVPLRGLFGLAAPPRALEEGEILAIVERFGRAAGVARAAGFAGVQIHAAHGYLISQFLSPLTNRRADRWGGPLERRMRLLLEVVRAARAAGGPGFSVMVKLNSADFQRGGFDEGESTAVVEALEAEGVDLLEISGGNYEALAMFGRASTRAREAYFLDYAQAIRARTRLRLMLTGGFRSAAAMAGAVAGGAVDVVGMARPLIVEPELPRRLLDAGAATVAAHDQIRARSRIVDDLIQGTWYARQLRRIAAGGEPDPRLGTWSSLLVELPRSFLFNPLALLLPRPRRALAAAPGRP